MNQQNGKTQETTCGLEGCVPAPQSERLGTIQFDSSIDGVESVRTSEQDCPGDYPPGTDFSGGSSVGKILGRLQKIKEEYLSYVRSHQARLETRLDESKEKESQFLKETQELEEEIYQLASQSENRNGCN